MDKIYQSKEEFAEQYRQHVRALSGKEFEDTSDIDRFTALAKMIAGDSRVIAAQTDERNRIEGKKRVYYFSIEFLIGRLLDNYLLNLGIRDLVAEAIADMGGDLDEIERQEPDPALGNGASAVSPPASSTPWHTRASRATVTACATATACSSRRSLTDARWKSPMSGSPRAIHGRSSARTRRFASALAGTSSLVKKVTV